MIGYCIWALFRLLYIGAGKYSPTHRLRIVFASGKLSSMLGEYAVQQVPGYILWCNACMFLQISIARLDGLELTLLPRSPE